MIEFGDARDGVYYARAATRILMERRLKTFVREDQPTHRWRLSRDVRNALAALIVGGDAPGNVEAVPLPLVGGHLFGYPISVVEGPDGTMELDEL